MIYTVAFSCLLVVTYGLPPEVEQKTKEMFTQLATECTAETGTSDDEVAQIKTNQLPTTHNGKCFLACINKKLAFQDELGKYDKASTYAQLEKVKPVDEDSYHKMKQIANTCFAEVTEETDECESAYNMMTCWEREAQTAGLKL